MKTAIVIPARYASSRFPGKPLAKIAGRTMLSRVVEIGRAAAKAHPGTALMIATDDDRIAAHAKEIGADCVMTSENCATGSDRVLEAAQKAGGGFNFIISLQGDAPFTPVSALSRMMTAFQDNPDSEVLTPVVRLNWEQLDRLRDSKKKTPFSGTTAIVANDGRAIWFSKNILPAMRAEEKLRAAGNLTPVYQHLGLYGYRTDVLERFVRLPQGHYEQLEGLEQLRMLENGITIHTVTIDADIQKIRAGIDSPEDIPDAEALLAKYGDTI